MLFVSKILPLTPLNPKIYNENPAKPLISQDRWGGGVYKAVRRHNRCHNCDPEPSAAFARAKEPNSYFRYRAPQKPARLFEGARLQPCRKVTLKKGL
jgi:hypothetical protein